VGRKEISLPGISDATLFDEIGENAEINLGHTLILIIRKNFHVLVLPSKEVVIHLKKETEKSQEQHSKKPRGKTYKNITGQVPINVKTPSGRPPSRLPIGEGETPPSRLPIGEGETSPSRLPIGERETSFLPNFALRATARGVEAQRLKEVVPFTTETVPDSTSGSVEASNLTSLATEEVATTSRSTEGERETSPSTEQPFLLYEVFRQ